MSSTKHTLSTTVNTLAKQFKENPVNWALVAVLAFVLKSFISSPKNTKAVQEAKHPDVMVFKNYTPLELLPFDGHNKPGNEQGRVLIAVNGSVYDVTRGKNFYGPGGPYANFAGRDASRGLAKNSFDTDMMSDPNGLIDKLEDLTADEWESLREWEGHFGSKYLLVGKLIEN